MKATIKRTISLEGKHFFKIYSGDKYIACREFKPDAPENNIYNEKKNFDEAIIIAHVIENGGESSEIIYETPEEVQNTIGNDVTKIDEDENI